MLTLIDFFKPTKTNATEYKLTFTDTFKPTEVKATDCMHALAFCLALQLMSEKSAGYLGPQRPTQLPSEPWARTRRDLARYLKQPLYLTADYSSSFSVDNPRMLRQKRVHALVR